MAESNSKLPAPLQKFAKDLRETLIKAETNIREMRAREASTKTKKLEKHELCPLCGGPDVNGRCKCIEGLQKNAQAGYGPGGEDLGAQGGGGMPMGMSEAPMKKCGPGCSGGKHMDKCDLSEVTRGKDLSKSGTTPHLDEAKPAKDLSKHMASSSAGALAPPKPRPATPVAAVNHELGGFQSLAHSPTAMPSAAGPGLASGGARKPLAHMGRGGVSNSATSGMIPNAKAEKNYGSARSPYGTGGPGHASQKNMPSNLKANMAPTAKGELPVVNAEPEKAVKGAKAPKAGADKTAKKQGSGGEIKKGTKLQKDGAAMTKAPPGKGVPGKQPVGQGGGDAHKVASTAKLPTPAGTKGTNAVTKPVPGKLKAAGAAEAQRLKGNSNVADLKGKLAAIQTQRATPAHPDTAASLADIRAKRQAAQGAVNKRTEAYAVANPQSETAKQLGSVDVDVSDFDTGPASLAGHTPPEFQSPGGDPTHGPNQPQKPGRLAPFKDEAGNAQPNAGAAMMRPAGKFAAMAPRPKMNADQAVAQMKGQGGGVGFLRGLIDRFHNRGKSIQPTGPGMARAPQMNADQAAQALRAQNPGMAARQPTNATSADGDVRTGPAPQGKLTRAPMTRFHGALPLQRGEMDMKKAALSLTKKDLDDDELDKGFSMNHSRRMLAVTRKRRAKKNR